MLAYFQNWQLLSGGNILKSMEVLQWAVRSISCFWGPKCGTQESEVKTTSKNLLLIVQKKQKLQTIWIHERIRNKKAGFPKEIRTWNQNTQPVAHSLHGQSNTEQRNNRTIYTHTHTQWFNVGMKWEAAEHDKQQVNTVKENRQEVKLKRDMIENKPSK